MEPEGKKNGLFARKRRMCYIFITGYKRYEKTHTRTDSGQSDSEYCLQQEVINYGRKQYDK